jgi:hypothetical protein
MQTTNPGLEPLLHQIVYGEWNRAELLAIGGALQAAVLKERHQNIKALLKFPYAKLKGVAPDELNGKLVTIQGINRGIVTFKFYGDGPPPNPVTRLPLKCFEPLG